MTEQSILSERLEQLDFGPFTHPPPITWHTPWFEKMLRDLDRSVLTFRDRRILVVSWLLAAAIGFFGNLASSALLGGTGDPRWDLGLLFLCASAVFAGLLLWYFPPHFKHMVQVWYGEEASKADHELFERFKFLGPNDGPLNRKLTDFMRLYNALMIRDQLRSTDFLSKKPQYTRIADVAFAEYGYETWLTIESREKMSWLSRGIEESITNEAVAICQKCATTILPLAWIDEKTPEESLSRFNDALKSLNLKSLKEKVRKQILEIKEWQ